MKKRDWTLEEETYIRENWSKTTKRKMREHLMVSDPTLRLKAIEMGLLEKHSPNIESVLEKVCLKCGESGKRFHANKTNRDGLNHYCMDCKSKYDIVELLSLGDKYCSSCNEYKPRVIFGIAKSRYGPVAGFTCRPCNVEEREGRYWSDPEKHRAIAKKSRDKMTVEQKREKGNQYAKNPKTIEYRKVYSAKYRKNPINIAKHKESANAYARKIVDGLHDKYILNILANSTGIDAKTLSEMDGIEEVIETKRATIRIKRETRSKSV